MKNFKRLLTFFLAITLFATSLFLTSCSTEQVEEKGESLNGTVVSENDTDLNEVTDNVDVTSENSVEEDTTSSENETEKVTDVEATTLKSNDKTFTVEEIVELYNKSANAVKTNAVKVVKNFEKRSIGELKMPAAIQGAAESFLPTFIKDDTDPIVYDTKDEIKTEFIVPNQNYVSRLTANDVVKATCTDNGKEYIITIKVKDEKNPVSGKGVGSAFDVIEAADVAKKAPSFVKELSTYYSDCEIKATINKSTGRLTHAVYTTPVKLNVIVDFLGTHNVTANFKYMKDYSITY